MPTLTPKVFIKRLNEGTDWSGKWSLVWDCGTHAILKKSPGQCWAGIGRARAYVSTRHVLVSLEDPGYGGSRLLYSAMMEDCEGRINKSLLSTWKALAIGGALPRVASMSDAVVASAAREALSDRRAIPTQVRRTSESWINPTLVSDADLIAEVQRRNLVIPDPARGGA